MNSTKEEDSLPQGDRSEPTRERAGFATVDNVDTCLQYLNHSLEIHGFPQLSSPCGDEKATLATACNCVYALVQYNQRQAVYREASLENQQRLQSEIKRLEKKLERSEEQIASKEKEIQSIVAKDTKHASELRSQLTKLQSEKDELQRISSAAQQVRTQLSHELKKREKDFCRLQERLSGALADRKERAKAVSSIQVLNPPQQREGRSRANWTGKKPEGDFYKMLIDGYEARKQELLSENSQLKASLRLVQQTVGALAEDFGLPVPPLEADAEGGEEGDPGATPQKDSLGSGLPYSGSREAVEGQLVEAMAAIREHLSAMEQHQQQQEASALPSQAEPCANTAPGSGAAAAELQAGKAELQRRLQAVEQERQALRAMAARLDQEQVQLEEAKSTLAEEQSSFTTALKLWAPSLAERNSLSQVLSPSLLQRLSSTSLKD